MYSTIANWIAKFAVKSTAQGVFLAKPTILLQGYFSWSIVYTEKRRKEIKVSERFVEFTFSTRHEYDGTRACP